jgi:predicted RNA binding protein YcfA (HicA-like mRNA interferase family)
VSCDESLAWSRVSGNEGGDHLASRSNASTCQLNLDAGYGSRSKALSRERRHLGSGAYAATASLVKSTFRLTSRWARFTVVVKEMKLRLVKRALAGEGCQVLSEDGGHTKWGCPCGKHTTAVPRHADISPGVVRNIIRDLECLRKGWLQ